MNFIEFVGFVAMLLFMVNAMRDAKKRRENPEEFEEEESEQAERLKAFLQSVSEDMQGISQSRPQKPVKPQQPVPTPKQRVIPPSKPVRRDHAEQIHTVYEDAYATKEMDPYAHPVTDAYGPTKKRTSRAEALMKRWKDRKDIIVWHEIIGSPTALKNEQH
ncbi:MAG: hypothetical protein ACXWM7_06225 [Parachlamydiaceae bacterium]